MEANKVKEYGNKVLSYAESLQFQGMLSRDKSVKPLMNIVDDEIKMVQYVLESETTSADINAYFMGRLEEVEWKLSRVQQRMSDYLGREIKVSE